MIERIKTKPGYKFLAVLFIIAIPFYLLHLVNQSELNDIKNNSNVQVQCLIKGKGYVIIDKSKITGTMENGGFIFENGYASNCEIVK